MLLIRIDSTDKVNQDMFKRSHMEHMRTFRDTK